MGRRRMTFAAVALPLPLKVPGTRTVLAWGVTERDRVIAAFDTESRARAYARKLTSVMRAK